MNRIIKVSNHQEITDAVDSIRKTLEGRKDAAHTSVCCLISEELLHHLLTAGYTDIRLRFRGGIFPHVEITAPGEEDRFDTEPRTDDPDRIGAEINLNLLNRYADRLDFLYRRGRNRYRIYYAGQPEPNLQHEIFGKSRKRSMPSWAGAPLS